MAAWQRFCVLIVLILFAATTVITAKITDLLSSHTSILSSPSMSQQRRLLQPVKSKKRDIRNLFRREAPQCGDPPIEITNLQNGKNHFEFTNESNYNIALTWAGVDNEAIIMLTTFELGMFVGASHLWRSSNHGKTFERISDKINHAYVRSNNGVFKSPVKPNMLLLVAYNEESSQSSSVFYVTTDGGENWSSANAPFELFGTIEFHSGQYNWILARSTPSQGSTLWMSTNFGLGWQSLGDGVEEFKWGTAIRDEEVVYFTQKEDASVTTYNLVKCSQLGKKKEVIAQDVFTFGVEGKFLFASIEVEKGTEDRLMHVSLDSGQTWNEAQIPAISKDRFYSILDMSEGMVFLHVDNPDDTGHGIIFTSDGDGIVFSQSLERHLYPNHDSVTDFYKVESLRGVYLASQINSDSSIRSMITFDRGGVWQTIQKPSGMACPSGSSECTLNIHYQFSQSKGINVPSGPLSAPNAVGIILAHGHVADALQTTPPDVFVTDDGGYTWTKTLDGPHHYAITDHGGLLVAVSAQSDVTDTLKFSYDEGQCWYSYKFIDEPIRFTGLLTEPGSKTLRVSLWGFGVDDRQWRVVVIDFTELLTQQCIEHDYVEWTAHEFNENNGCLLGKKEVYRRLKKSSFCRNGYGYEIKQASSKCTCTKDDYECDYGFFRNTNQEECEENPSLKGKTLEVCIEGEEEDLVTTGYRLIPGDECKDGYEPPRKLTDAKKKCQEVAKAAAPKELSSHPHRGGHTAGIVIGLLLLIVIVIAAAALFVLRKNKYFRHNKKAVYRYSTLNQVDELDNEIDLLSNGANTTISYHDDSDEDMLE